MTDPRASLSLPVPLPEDVALRAYDARALLDGGDSVGLRLDGTLYILRLTKTGKLILTK